MVYEVYVKMLMNSVGLRVMAPPEYGSLTGFYANKIAAMVQHLSLLSTRSLLF